MTDKQKMFISEYLKDFNATQAAIRAGYSKDTAKSQGNRLLTNVDIKAKVSEYVDSVIGANKTALEARIIDELTSIAFADVTTDARIVTRDRKDEHGKYETYQSVEFSDTEDSTQGRAVAGIKISEKGNIELKYYDKQRALELLGKYMAMFTERIEVKADAKVTHELDLSKLSKAARKELRDAVD